MSWVKLGRKLPNSHPREQPNQAWIPRC
jgi:hypothetical protein